MIRIRGGFIRDDETLGEIASLLSGYHLALQIHGIDEGFELGAVGPFCSWLSWNYGTSLTAGWASAVAQLTRDGESPVETFFRLLNAFREASARSARPGE
jgi:hypothetical protein